jgi:hypothetical protein
MDGENPPNDLSARDNLWFLVYSPKVDDTRAASNFPKCT